MKIKITLVLSGLLLHAASFGQSKTFKEVSEEMTSQMKVITQDESLIGYLVFTRLERANKDSFNYQVTIMDENLNDIGKVGFKEKTLELQAVSFDQDVLCLSYLKSEVTDFKGMKANDIARTVSSEENSVLFQLINLDGKIIGTKSYKASLSLNDGYYMYKNARNASIVGHLKHGIVIKNIPGKGFAIFYGDNARTKLIAMDVSGKEVWEKNITESNVLWYSMLTTPSEIYMLTRRSTDKGHFLVSSYSVGEGKSYEDYRLKDKKGNDLSVISFESDPVSGKPLLTGLIIDPAQSYRSNTVKGFHKGAIQGVFSISVNGPKKGEVKERFSYWDDGSKAPEIANNGKLSSDNVYPKYETVIRDYKGNTYFIGSGYVRKTRVGSIVASVITAPLLVPPIMLMGKGTHKAKQDDIYLLRQDSAGKLKYENMIKGNDSRFYASSYPVSYYDSRMFYTVTNKDSKSNFLIIKDGKNTIIYNVEKKKVVRTVPHKEGSTYTSILPAKEGHVMVTEFDRKARETRLSIEAL